MTTYLYEDGLETERLVTRWLVNDDYKAWIGFYSDPECIRYFPEEEKWQSPEVLAIRWVEQILARYQERRYGLQALIEKRTGEVVGHAGLSAEIVDDKIELEVGYHLFRKYWGKGYATEAAKRFIDYAFDNDLASSVISLIDVRNLASQRVAVKNGLVREGLTTFWGLNVFVYRIKKH